MGYGDWPYPFSLFWAICNERREQIDRAYITIVQPVAFSGGVDSTFLLHAAKAALGGNALAATASSATFPERELKEAEAFCQANGIRQIVFLSEELSVEGFAHNPKNRCYLCKRELFGKILNIQREEGIAAVLECSNIDDNGDYRPGLQAVAELGILSPLREHGFTKLDIRMLSKHLGLATWNKQSFACLSSRFPYGDTINVEKLGMVDKAEQLLLDMGFTQLRVRIHGNNCPHRAAPGTVSPVHGGTGPTEGGTGLQGNRLCLCHARYPRLSYRQHERDAESSVGA